MLIEIICTGDEVLTGKIVNSNFSYMAQKLEDFGLSVTSGTTVGDDREDEGHRETQPDRSTREEGKRQDEGGGRDQDRGRLRRHVEDESRER